MHYTFSQHKLNETSGLIYVSSPEDVSHILFLHFALTECGFITMALLSY